MDYLNNNSFPICYDCKSTVNVSSTKSDSISFFCRCNKHTIPLTAYYSLLNVDRPSICKLHYNNNGYYCLQCLSFLCSRCINSHVNDSHFIIIVLKTSLPSLYQFKTLHVNNDLYNYCYELYQLKDGRLCLGDHHRVALINPTAFEESGFICAKENLVDPYSYLELKNQIFAVSYINGMVRYYSLDYMNKGIEIHKRNYEGNKDKYQRNLLCEIDDEKFALAGSNGKIYIISTEEPFDILFILERHSSNVLFLLKLKNTDYLMSAPEIWLTEEDDKIGKECEKTIRIWDLNEKQCIRIIPYIECFDMYQYNELIVLIGGYQKITLINIKTFSVDGVITDSRINGNVVTCFLRLYEENILFGCVAKNGKSGIGIVDVKNKRLKEFISNFNLEKINDMIYLKENVIAFGGKGIKIVSI